MAANAKASPSFLAAGFVGAILGMVAGIAILDYFVITHWDGNTLLPGLEFISWILPALVMGLATGAFAAVLLFRSIRSEGAASKKKAKRVFSVVVALCPIGFAYWVSSCVTYNTNPPPDEELIANFKAHEDAFKHLTQMAQMDRRITRFDSDQVFPTDPGSTEISEDRMERYRSLLREANLSSDLTSSDNGDKVVFTYWRIGSAVSDGLCTGYAYLSYPPKHLEARLDGFEPKGRVEEIRFRRIQGNWYIYVQYTTG